MSYLDSDPSSIDLRAALDSIVRRWWVVVGCVAVSVGVVFAQDSGLRSEPNGDLILTKTYEAVVETDDLSIVKVDPAAISPMPSFDSQLAIIQSDATRDELRKATSSDAVVEVTRSEPTFTIVESLDDANNRVSFLATGTPSYTFRCVGSDEASCSRLIDAYVARTTELRKESVLGGLEGGLSLTSSLIDAANDRLTSASLSPGQRAAQEAELASLMTKRDALQKASSLVTGELIPVSQQSMTAGKSTASVSASSYGFGLGLGFILGILLALQLAAMDKRIRFARQVRRVDDQLPVIGSPFPRRDDAQATALAAALRDAQRHGAASALIVADHPSLREFAHDVTSRISSLPTTLIQSISAMTVDHLAPSNSQVAVVLIKAGETTRRQLAESIGLVTAGGSRLLGVALVD